MPAIRPPAATPATAAGDDWRTTDREEIERRRQRARTEAPRVENRDRSGRFPVFSNFLVHSPSGVTYEVEIRDVARRQFACGCVDFRVNGLGTCKHVEAVLLRLEAERAGEFTAAAEKGSPRIDLVVDHAGQTLRVARGLERLPRALRRWFDATGGRLQPDALPGMVLEVWAQMAAELPELRISQEIGPWLECRRRDAEAVALRRTYEQAVQSGRWPAQETRRPLYPYQREGMLHLACAERALLADEMGLGKTVQAVAACALLHRLGRARRALIVTPASLKGEWEEAIAEFTTLRAQVVSGDAVARMATYAQVGSAAEAEMEAPFFLIANYEQMLPDALAVNERLRPDIVILDEAQRIKNWNSKTALAVKRLQSRYAFVLTGTPLENRLDELYSLVSFLDPSLFGPLFRFNREYLDFDERGRPRGYRNLDRLRERLRPILLRRRKSEVAAELPGRSDRTFLIPLGDAQRIAYRAHETEAARLAEISRRRALTPVQRERLLRELAMARMLCDTPYILDRRSGSARFRDPPTTAAEAERLCPKLGELSRILRECMANPAVKVLIFSEWERMLELVRGLCQRLKIAHAFHAGSVSPGQRRGEVARFKNDPLCRIFLSTDTGGVGLNLPQASVVIHCDQPWNPARLEQRVARAWRPEQTRPVTVLHLVSEGTIEQRMLATLAGKQALSERVLDDPRADRGAQLPVAPGEGATVGRDELLDRLDDLLPPRAGAKASPGSAANGRRAAAPPAPVPVPVNDPAAFCAHAAATLRGALVSVEERTPKDAGSVAGNVVFVVVEPGTIERARELLEPARAKYFPGPAPVQLEIIDRPTAELLRRLSAAGVVNETVHRNRQLYPAAAASTPAAPEARRPGQGTATQRPDPGREFFAGIRARSGKDRHVKRSTHALAFTHRHPALPRARRSAAGRATLDRSGGRRRDPRDKSCRRPRPCPWRCARA